MGKNGVDLELEPNEKKCPDCKGHGKIDLVFRLEDPCRTCDGDGKILDPDETQEDLMTAILSWRCKSEVAVVYDTNKQFRVSPGDLVHINRDTGKIHHVSTAGGKGAAKIGDGFIESLIERMDESSHVERESRD